MTAGRVAVGHPVDVGSGVQFTAAHDVEILGESQLVFRRYYSTALLDDPPGPLGRAWVHGLDAALVRDLDGYRFHGHDGAVIQFDDPDDRLAQGERLVNLGECMELRREGELVVLVHWHDLTTPVQRYEFTPERDDRYVLRAIVDPAGHGVALERDARGRVSRAVQTLDARCIVFTYSADDRLAELAVGYAAHGGPTPRVVARYRYDDRGMLASVEDARGRAQRYEYDPGGRLVREEGRSGGVWRMRYDAAGRCVETVGDNGRGLRRFQYLGGGSVTEVVDAAGRSTLYECNARGQVERETAPSGAQRATMFDDLGRIVEEIDPLGAVTGYRYDDRGDVAEITWPVGGSRAFAWNDDHQATEIRDADGAVWRLGYQRGALVSVEDPLGRHQAYLRDGRNAIVDYLTPGGNRVVVSRDAAVTVRSYADAYGLLLRETLDERCMPTVYEGPRGLARTFTYDDLGGLASETDSTGATWRFEHDPDGQLTAIHQPDGTAERWLWSPYGECEAHTDAAGFTHDFVHDPESRLVQVRNPAGEVLSLIRDLAGNIAEMHHFDGSIERFGYDLADRPVQHQRADGRVLGFAYDAAGNVEAVTCDGVTLIAQRFEHGRPVEVRTPGSVVERAYDACGGVVEETQNGARVAYAQHASGALAGRDFELAGCGPLRFRVDLRGRLVSVADARGERQEFAYGPDDMLVERTMGASVERREHDAEGRLTLQRVPGVVERRYHHDGVGQLVAVDDSLRGRRDYQYDLTGRLAASSSPDGAVSYRYDPSGNLRAMTHRELEYDRGNRLRSDGLRSWERDADGRVVRVRDERGDERFEWNPLDQLVGIGHPDGSVTRYAYDGFGRRVSKRSGDVVTEYYWSGDDLMCERSGASVTDYLLTEGEAHAVWQDGRCLHVVSTGLDAPRPQEVLSDDGALAWHGTFDDWGRLLREHGAYASQRLRLPGQFADDESGLSYNRHRYYDPAVGQFVSPDPLRYLASFNTYRYAPNPISWEDPLGLVCGKGPGKYSVYVLEDNGSPRKILYVGITEQHPGARASQHRSGGPGTPPKSFDRMRVVANGLCYRQARNLEGSALVHAWSGNVTGQTPTLLNSQRPSTPGYYHSYNNPPGGNRTMLNASTVNTRLARNYGVY